MQLVINNRKVVWNFECFHVVIKWNDARLMFGGVRLENWLSSLGN